MQSPDGRKSQKPRYGIADVDVLWSSARYREYSTMLSNLGEGECRGAERIG